jgi:hypothetical protein
VRAKVINRAFPPEKRELAYQAIGERQPKLDLNELDEMIPRWRPTVEFQPVVPHLCIVEQVE